MQAVMANSIAVKIIKPQSEQRYASLCPVWLRPLPLAIFCAPPESVLTPSVFQRAPRNSLAPRMRH